MQMMLVQLFKKSSVGVGVCMHCHYCSFVPVLNILLMFKHYHFVVY